MTMIACWMSGACAAASNRPRHDEEVEKVFR